MFQSFEIKGISRMTILCVLAVGCAGGQPFNGESQRESETKRSLSVVSDSWRPHGLKPTRLLRPRDSPGKNTRVGCHALFHVIFLCRKGRRDMICITGIATQLQVLSPGANPESVPFSQPTHKHRLRAKKTKELSKPPKRMICKLLPFH